MGFAQQQNTNITSNNFFPVNLKALLTTIFYHRKVSAHPAGITVE